METMNKDLSKRQYARLLRYRTSGQLMALKERGVNLFDVLARVEQHERDRHKDKMAMLDAGRHLRAERARKG